MAVDLFASVAAENKLSLSFIQLRDSPLHSPARRLIKAMSNSLTDSDGNLVEQFQTSGFDARFWELYLSATINHLGLHRVKRANAPDFILEGPQGAISMEAVTSNPSNKHPDRSYDAPFPHDPSEYDRTFAAVKIGRALYSKLVKDPPYWNLPDVSGRPFILAVQDFHMPTSTIPMMWAVMDYAFGYKHDVVDGIVTPSKITSFTYLGLSVPGPFFELPGSENVSAILVNPVGTIGKFQRMACEIGLCNRDMVVIHRGSRRAEVYEHPSVKIDFDYPVLPLRVHPKLALAMGMRPESWEDGCVMIHNPHALYPIDHTKFPMIGHEFLLSDGMINSALSDNQIFLSWTQTILRDRSLKADEH